ncbi:MAG: c-type cytochrome [Acidobacteria bacterium]|nr:c-type cytochrome [Acidobacteriota bacterium]
MRRWNWLVAALPLAAQTPLAGQVAAGQLEEGARIFQQGCAVGYCHGAGGAASRGPRLRGRTFARDYLIRTVANGLPGTAMPPFKGRLKEAEIAAVADYVMSLRDISESAAAQAVVASASGTIHTAPADPGRELFFDAVRGTRCGTCHALDGLGAAIGPDVLKPDKSRTPKTVRLKTGESFPGVVLGTEGGSTVVYDLTGDPPVRRSLLATEIAAISAGSVWKHDTGRGRYSAAEMRQIEAFLTKARGR